MMNAPLVESFGRACHRAGIVESPRTVALRSTAVRILCLAGLAALASGCTGLSRDKEPRPTPSVVVEPETKSDAWMQIATAADRSRVERVGLAWESALADARRSFAGEIRREGALLQPAVALARPAPTPGSYNCRLIKLGKATAKAPAFERFKPFFCYVEVENELLTIVKQTGSQRPAGRLWEDDNPNRLIFLGSLALGSEDQPLAYGDDPKRDMAGILERIGPFKWRLVIPWPQSTSKLDVFELTPVANQPT
jgi:hypothetical protein